MEQSFHIVDWLLLASLVAFVIFVVLAYFRSGLAVILAILFCGSVILFSNGIEQPNQGFAAFAITQVLIMVISIATNMLTIAIWIAHWKFKRQYFNPAE
jgi:hypothetical protein